jgi:hypothetical protein
MVALALFLTGSSPVADESGLDLLRRKRAFSHGRWKRAHQFALGIEKDNAIEQYWLENQWGVNMKQNRTVSLRVDRKHFMQLGVGFVLSLMLTYVPMTLVFADDGQLLVRSISSEPGPPLNPEPEGEHTSIKLMNFYVPTQRAIGSLESIIYYNIDEALIKTEEKAKPLIAFYTFGPVNKFDDSSTAGFPGHGRRDAYAAVSLDDGETWQRTNLSNSANLSSFVTSTAIPDPGVPLPAFEVTSTWPTIVLAIAIPQGGGKYKLKVIGNNALPDSTVEVRNAITFDELGTKHTNTGNFNITINNLWPYQIPCAVQAGYSADAIWGPYKVVINAPDNCVGPTEVTLINDYPGDVTNGTHVVAGNKILAVWQSKFCQSGNPVWETGYPIVERASYLDINNTTDLYLVDLFGVSGPQGSLDYPTLEILPGEFDEIAEVPHSCLWSARGVLREDPEEPGKTQVVWFQAERLTSGRSDVNAIEVACIAGAGCAISWHEDPIGLLPDKGDGPGVDWLGDNTSNQTDIWYSFIAWEDFDIVDMDGVAMPLADNILDTNRPQPYVPMASPIRLTNNARCQIPITGYEFSYCNDVVAGAYGIKNQCIDFIEIEPAVPLCVVDTDGDGDGDLPNIANTAASRAHLSLQPRDSDGDGITDDAWVMVVVEETKGLDEYSYLNDQEWSGTMDDTGTPCLGAEDNCQAADIGKNILWFSFNLGSSATSEGIGEEYSLVENLVYQGDQLNAPEVNWRTGTYYPPMDTADMWDFEEYNYVIFNTEIARRSSMMAQSLSQAKSGDSALTAFPLWKEGLIPGGGPADILGRRFTVDPSLNEMESNPYDFRNLVCEGRMEFTNEANPYYPKGLCLYAAINLSASTPLDCEPSIFAPLSDGICPGHDYNCANNGEFGQLCFTNNSLENPEDPVVFDKLLSWYTCPGSNGSAFTIGSAFPPPPCYSSEPSITLNTNLDDRSWYMPLEVAEMQQGFLDGDFVMTAYTWSPNWQHNLLGRDLYEMYVRRSFDGGLTWTTLPPAFVATNGLTYNGEGTLTCETWRDIDSTHACTPYAAGYPEQPRNVSQLYQSDGLPGLLTIISATATPTLASMPDQCPVWLKDDIGDCLTEWLLFEPITDMSTLDGNPTDVREPSRFFVVYQTGDITTVAADGGSVPLDLYYGRGEFFGDIYTVWAEIDTGFTGIDDCYPNNPHANPYGVWAADTGFCNEFDTLEGRPLNLAGQASITASAYADFLYSVWPQITVDGGGFVESDAIFRRVWYLDEYIPECCAWQW